MLKKLTQPNGETTRGVHTTEFYLTVLSLVVVALNNAGVFDLFPMKWATIMGGIVTAAYMYSRGQAKKGVAPK